VFAFVAVVFAAVLPLGCFPVVRFAPAVAAAGFVAALFGGSPRA
jgi:hypothetical protein